MVIYEVDGKLFNVVSCRVVGAIAVSPKARDGGLGFLVAAFLVKGVSNTFRKTFRVRSWSGICQVTEVDMTHELSRGREGGMTLPPHTFERVGRRRYWGGRLLWKGIHGELVLIGRMMRFLRESIHASWATSTKKFVKRDI
jgi:hypothetical protein